MNHELQNIIEAMQHPTPTTCELHGVVVHIEFVENNYFILKHSDRSFAELSTSGELMEFNDEVIPRPTMWRIVADFVEALQA